MKNSKKFLIGCAALTAAGIVLTAAGTAMGGIVYNVRLGIDGLHVSSPAIQDKENDGLYEKNEEVEPFKSIDIELEYADVYIMTSDTGEYRITCSLPKTREMEYGVSDGKLVLKSRYQGAVMIGDISFFSIGRDPHELKEAPQVSVYVPKDAQLSEITVKTDSGNVECQDIYADLADITADYGAVRLENNRFNKLSAAQESGNLHLEQVQGADCKVKNAYGNITIKDAAFSGDLSMKLESGDISCQNVKMRDLLLENEYGKVSGQQMNLRNMKAELESGDCSMEEIKLEQCEINSAYGNVDLKLSNPLPEYECDLKAEYGEIRVDGENMGETYRSIEHGKSKRLEIRSESGDIEIR